MTDKEQIKNNFEKVINVPTKQQTIIDGVDVKECDWLWLNTEKPYNSRCFKFKDVYSQCEDCKKYPNCYYKLLARKTQECKELKEKFKKFFGIDNQECWDIAFLKNENARYLKALEEIEGIAKGMRSIFIEEVSITASQLNDRIYRETTERFRQILDIISKANPTKNKRGGK